MRVLLKKVKKKSTTLTVVEAIDVSYDPEARELCVNTHEEYYTVSRVVEANARAYMQELLETGRCDLSMYEAQ